MGIISRRVLESQLNNSGQLWASRSKGEGWNGLLSDWERLNPKITGRWVFWRQNRLAVLVTFVCFERAAAAGISRTVSSTSLRPLEVHLFFCFWCFWSLEHTFLYIPWTNPRFRMPDQISVSEFLSETTEDYNSPTTSSFTTRLQSCRNTVSVLEEVRNW